MRCKVSRKCNWWHRGRRGRNGTASTSCFYRVGCAKYSESSAASGFGPSRAFLQAGGSPTNSVKISDLERKPIFHLERLKRLSYSILPSPGYKTSVKTTCPHYVSKLTV